jgi:sugar lactone lactonase YvrE
MPNIVAGPFTYRVDETWAKFPADGAEGEAVAVACDSQDRVHVFLRGPSPVQVFLPDGTPVKSWGEERFRRPHGITLDRHDTIYCTDDFGHAVHLFTADGRWQRTLGTVGVPSDTGATSIDYRTIRHSGPPFHYPTNVAVAESGEVFVADGYGNARVHCFSREGTLLRSWGEPGAGPGQFHVPHGIAIDAAGMIHVCDRENSRVQRFTPAGQFAAEWTDLARPAHMVFDRLGRAFVAELGFRAGRWPGTGEARPGETGGRVSVLDPHGRLIARWGGGERPCEAGDFFAPHGICVDSQGAVYVAEVAWTAGGRKGLVPGHCHTLQKFVPVQA